MKLGHRLRILCASAAALAACGKQTPLDSGREPGASPGRPPAYAVFAEHQVVIDRLETPAPLAMTAGSAWTLASSSFPEIVSLESGALVAHRNGRAEIRSA